MTSSKDRLYQQLVPSGFYYKVLRDVQHLKAGDLVRVLNSYFGSNKEDSGFIVQFPDREDLRLHSRYDKEIIENIVKYLEPQEKFDYEAAVAEYNTRMEKLREEWEKKQREEEEALRSTVHSGTQKGLSPKEAYKALRKKQRLR